MTEKSKVDCKPVCRNVELAGEQITLDPKGCAWLEKHQTLIVSDLHLEKASAGAARGYFIPPWDTQETLKSVQTLVDQYKPEKIISLGDSFHDHEGFERMQTEDRNLVFKLTSKIKWIWITGNHDKQIANLPGEILSEINVGRLTFRHVAEQECWGEVSGHYHPKARVKTRGGWITKPCFIVSKNRLMMPAFGTFTGGLSVEHEQIKRLFEKDSEVYLMGNQALFKFPMP